MASADKLFCYGHAAAFGVMKNATETAIYQGEAYKGYDRKHKPQLALDTSRKELQLYVFMQPAQARPPETYVFTMRLPQIQSFNVVDANDTATVVIQLRFPPLVHKILPTGRWPRQTILEKQSGKYPIELMSENSHIETGRWLSFVFQTAGHEQLYSWRRMSPHLAHFPIEHNIVRMNTAPRRSSFDWLRKNATAATRQSTTSMSMLSIAEEEVHLPYEIKYQLEVCISHGYLKEPSLTYAFALKLAALIHESGIGVARTLLEHIAGLKQWFPEAMDIFKHIDEVTVRRRKVPGYCVLSQAATVTPTTIYFHTPVVEVSNRVLRQYNQYGQRFLRVKFRDEDYLGRIQSSSEEETFNDNIYARVEQALKNGIIVGGRHFEFLAFGNSQLREGGAYFFASDGDLTAAKIRAGLGDFSDIKVVAKYASRMGQAFSTTRAATKTYKLEHIPDIERNGYCFTDGVGKMPLYIAQMVAHDLNLPLAQEHCPSVYQFRRAGCKGILVVDPHLKGNAIHIRPSQNKFPAMDSGLEICRSSHFTSTYLNQQFVLLLSVLGVPDFVIMDRLHSQKAHLQRAMVDPVEAVELLCKSVDKHQMTTQLASMVQAGFMKARDPFLMNCLHLWLSWSIKTMREKAKILIPEGAFLFGCIDETATLRGSFSEQWSYSSDKIDLLPEVFVQITQWDPATLQRTDYKIIEGVCLLARNPSLHPGDIRVVRAVNVPQLRHLRDVIVFPQTGDRDIPSMCSGGDLDGDDYIIIWDQGLIPREWNHEPMDYAAPSPRVHNGSIERDDIIDFFVEHMRYDNLGRIATNHRYWADQLNEGAKHENCIRLAALHSTAVDFAKTGVPALMGRDLQPSAWPQWSKKKGRPERLYNNGKILHQIFDTKAVEFEVDKGHKFDETVLNAFPRDEQLLESAKVLKTQYDIDVRHQMDQYGIKTEFEVWTAFVLDHNDECKDWTLKEALGLAMNAIRQQYREAAFAEAGTNKHERDPAKLQPYIVAMYTVTADEVTASNQQDVNQLTPLMSFPWIFQYELGLLVRSIGQGQNLVTPAVSAPITSAKANAALASSNSLSAGAVTSAAAVRASAPSTPAVPASCLSSDTTSTPAILPLPSPATTSPSSHLVANSKDSAISNSGFRDIISAATPPSAPQAALSFSPFETSKLRFENVAPERIAQMKALEAAELKTGGVSLLAAGVEGGGVKLGDDTAPSNTVDLAALVGS